jgi:hypothetical protein
MKNVFKIQPLWLIKKYFGDKVRLFLNYEIICINFPYFFLLNFSHIELLPKLN